MYVNGGMGIVVSRKWPAQAFDDGSTLPLGMTVGPAGFVMGMDQVASENPLGATRRARQMGVEPVRYADDEIWVPHRGATGRAGGAGPES